MDDDSASIAEENLDDDISNALNSPDRSRRVCSFTPVGRFCSGMAVVKWGLKFHGDCGQSLNELIVRVQDNFVRKLRVVLIPFDNDERLTEEIRKRNQSKDASVNVYVVVIKDLFARHADPYSEEQQLRILKRNLTTFNQTQLDLVKMSNIQKLVAYGQSLETTKLSGILRSNFW